MISDLAMAAGLNVLVMGCGLGLWLAAAGIGLAVKRHTGHSNWASRFFVGE